MAQELTLAMRLFLDAQRFTRGLDTSRTGVSKFVNRTKSEITELRGAFDGVRNAIAAIGVGASVTAIGVQSAQLDKSLTQIGLTAGVGEEKIGGLRKELFKLSQVTGQNVEDLQRGFGNLVAAGLDWGSSTEVIRATNAALGLTSATADQLTSSLQVAASIFKFDLSEPGKALELLDKMVVAGRAGNAEIEQLSDVFAGVGADAQAAGLSFEKTLALVETLSAVQKDPSKLTTLTSSTLRLFSNYQYRKNAEKASGVKFFNDDGSQRDPEDVLSDFQRNYLSLQTQEKRQNFIGQTFSGVDQDTMKGLRLLLDSGSLEKFRSIYQGIFQASGTVSRELPRGLSNAVDQVGRLMNTLREAADSFVEPLKSGIETGIKKLLDSKKDGGFELSGEGIAGIAGGALVGAYGLKKFGGPLLQKVLGKSGDLAKGVVMGNALEQVGAATPVFVVNMPDGGIGSTASSLLGGAAFGSMAGKAAKMFGGARAGAALIAAAAGQNLGVLASYGAGGVAAGAGLVGAAGVAGYAAGTGVYKLFDETSFADKLGGAIAKALSFVSSDARSAVEKREKYEAAVKIELDDKRARVTNMQSNSPKLSLDVNTGRMSDYR